MGNRKGATHARTFQSTVFKMDMLGLGTLVITHTAQEHEGKALGPFNNGFKPQ